MLQLVAYLHFLLVALHSFETIRFYEQNSETAHTNLSISNLSIILVYFLYLILKHQRLSFKPGFLRKTTSRV